MCERDYIEIEESRIVKLVKIFKALFYEEIKSAGIYALCCAYSLVKEFLLNCKDENDFKDVKVIVLRLLSEFTQELFAQDFKGGNYGRF